MLILFRGINHGKQELDLSLTGEGRKTFEKVFKDLIDGIRELRIIVKNSHVAVIVISTGEVSPVPKILETGEKMLEKFLKISLNKKEKFYELFQMTAYKSFWERISYHLPMWNIFTEPVWLFSFCWILE